MADGTILFKPTRSRIWSIDLDVSVSEQHQGDVDVTDHPVEKGFNVTDHVRAKPETITIDGFVSNTPTYFPEKSNVRVNQDGTFTGETIARTATQGVAFTDKSNRKYTWETNAEGDGSRGAQAYKTLKTIKDSGSIITISTSLRTYENMVMTSLSVPRVADNGNGLRFTASFKQIRVVNSATDSTTRQITKAKPKKELEKKAPQTSVRQTSTFLDGAKALISGVSNVLGN